MNLMRNLVYTGAFALVALPASVAADIVHLYRDDVVPVVMQTELNFKDTREGDVFRADVADSRMLPIGSRLEGVVKRVEQKHGNRPGFMDIEFTSIILPDGHRTNFRATPIALSKNYVTRDKYGRWEAKKGAKKETVVLGTTAGGLILGSLIKKPFEGAIIGALVGIIAGETDKDDIGDGNIVVAKGSKVGARVDSDLSLDYDGRWDDKGYYEEKGEYDREGYNTAGYDRYGYDRHGRYNARYDTAKHGSDNRDDYNGSSYDRYGYDRNGNYNPRYDTTRNDRQTPGTSKRDSNNRDLAIEIDNKALRYNDDEMPYRNDWVVMVPLRSTAEQLGYHVSKEPSGDFRIENDDDVLVIEQDSRGYSLNRRRGSLPSATETREGVTYVPIDVFTKLTRGNVYVNGAKYKTQS